MRDGLCACQDEVSAAVTGCKKWSRDKRDHERLNGEEFWGIAAVKMAHFSQMMSRPAS